MTDMLVAMGSRSLTAPRSFKGVYLRPRLDEHRTRSHASIGTPKYNSGRSQIYLTFSLAED